MAGVGGAAVLGRLSPAGTEAHPTELYSFKLCPEADGVKHPTKWEE
jgi:hypothetical protein